MAGTNDRARTIAALADRLRPLAGKTRGMPIEAPDWNAIVDVLSQVLSIDASRESDLAALDDQRYAPVGHQHLGEVAAPWLDADLQARTADGGGGVATRQVLSDMQARLDALQKQVTQLIAMVQTQQGSTDRAAANDLDRTRQIQAFDGRLGGVEGLKTAVAQITGAQASLAGNLDTVLALRKSLSDANGAPIDVAGLANKVGDLQTLRSSLTGVDGKPLRLSDIQLQILDVSNRIPTVGGPALDERLGALSADLAAKAEAAAQARADALRGEFQTANTALSASLGARIDQSVAAGRDAGVQAAKTEVTAAETRLNAGLAANLAAAQANLTSSVQQSVNDSVSAKLSDLDTRIATVVDNRVPGVRAQVGADVQANLTAVLSKAVADGQSGLQTRVGTVENSVSALSADLPVQIKTVVDASTAATQSRLDAGLAGGLQSVQTQIAAATQAEVKTEVAAGLNTVPTLAAQAVADGLQTVDARVAAAVASSAAGLPTQIGAVVDARLAAANLPGMIQAANAMVAVQLRDEIAASAAGVQANMTKTLNANTIALRGEFSSAIGTRIPVQRLVEGGVAGGISVRTLPR